VFNITSHKTSATLSIIYMYSVSFIRMQDKKIVSSTVILEMQAAWS